MSVYGAQRAHDFQQLNFSGTISRKNEREQRTDSGRDGESLSFFKKFFHRFWCTEFSLTKRGSRLIGSFSIFNFC